MIREHERAARCSARAIVLGASLAALSGCQQPTVGAPAQSGQTTGAPQVEITGATVSATNHLLVSLTVKSGGVPMSKEQLVALRPTFTLAALSPHPVDGLRAWRSLLLTGSQTLAQLPPGGPGTPAAAILTNQTQPGSESTGALDGGAGAFTYLFANALPASYVSTETHRVGVFLDLADGKSAATATYDFVPGGAPPAPRDTVLDANCNHCHGAVRAHDGRRVGVRVCLTCHTWQNADPDTVDPAAVDGTAVTTAPNPLELGRLVHRIHRGKTMPTLFTASSKAAAPALPPATVPPLPFLPGRNTAIVGRKFSVVAANGSERIFGRIVTRYDVSGVASKIVAEGLGYPRELRDCDACHAGAPQAYEVLYAISRRTCSGCHPDVWFQDLAVAPITDAVHFPHTGGPQPDDTQCSGCHVAATATQPKVWVRHSEAHVALRNSPYWDRPIVQIVSVSNLKPGAAPTVRFKVTDRVGTVAPLSTPSVTTETGGPAPSPVTRAFSSFRILLVGPAAPDYDVPPSGQITSGDTGNPNVLTLPGDPVTGEIAYTFVSTLPATAAGTWAVGIEGRRRSAVPTYDVPTQTFRWPYTGETVTESPDDPIAFVDTATGTWTAAAPGAAVPRRKIVSEEKCLACHGRFELHGSQRHQVEHCLLCHVPARTDWAQRPKVVATGNVNLAATYDAIEERSIQLKVMLHRIHTGSHQGAASLEAIEPHIVYGNAGSVNFFDDSEFPGDLGNCTLCHVGTTYRVDSVPADAPPTLANENPTILHAGTVAHTAGEPARPPIQAACLGCHANGFTDAHAISHTVNGVEQCAQCHVRGSTSVDIVHGLARPDATIVSASFSSIVQNILVPRCASAACHGGNPPANFPRLDADGAYDAIVGVASQQASGVKLVDPYAPDASYMLIKMRGDAASVGGIATPMPIGDAALDASDLAAFEAWILNGAPND